MKNIFITVSLLFSLGVSAQSFDTFLVASMQQANTGNPNPEIWTGYAFSYTSEANSLPSVGTNNGEMVSISTTSASVADSGTGIGSYVLEVVNTAAGGQSRLYSLQTVGEIYEFRVWGKVMTGSNGAFSFYSGTDNSSVRTYASGSYVETIGEFEATTTQLKIKFFGSQAGTSGDISRYKVSIKLKND